MTYLINRLKTLTAENKPIFYKHLDAISDRLDIENPNANELLNLFQSCRDLVENENHRGKILSIWMKLKSNKKITLTKAHFMCSMQFYQISGDVDGAEATWKEMQKARIKQPP